jgi:hypothetical protein
MTGAGATSRQLVVAEAAGLEDTDVAPDQYGMGWLNFATRVRTVQLIEALMCRAGLTQAPEGGARIPRIPT